MIISDPEVNVSAPWGQILDDLSQVRIVAVRFGNRDPVRQVGHQSQTFIHSEKQFNKQTVFILQKVLNNYSTKIPSLSFQTIKF